MRERFSLWKFRYRRSGLVIAESDWIPNVVTRECHDQMMDLFFRATATATPVRFEVGLCNSIPDVSTTGATLSGEMSGSGYGRGLLTRDTTGFPVLSTNPDNPADTPYTITPAPVTFMATGGTIGSFQSAFLVARVQLGSDITVLTDRLLCTAGTNVNQITDGDAFDVTIQMTLGS